MIKYFCDICGREMKPERFKSCIDIVIEENENLKDNICTHLVCNHCLSEILNLINEIKESMR